MNGQSNVITAERALKAVWNGARRIDRDALFAPNFRFRNLGESDDVTNLCGLRKRICHVRAAHPDGHLSDGRRIRIWKITSSRGGRFGLMGVQNQRRRAAKPQPHR